MTIEYTKLESIHSALQELQNKYAIPDNDVDLNNALQFTEDLREPHLLAKFNVVNGSRYDPEESLT